MPLLRELVYDIRERARAVTLAFLTNHLNPLITASNGLTACCIRVAHRNSVRQREFHHGTPPLVSLAVMNNIDDNLPHLQHLFLHSSNIPHDAIGLLQQLHCCIKVLRWDHSIGWVTTPLTSNFSKSLVVCHIWSGWCWQQDEDKKWSHKAWDLTCMSYQPVIQLLHGPTSQRGLLSPIRTSPSYTSYSQLPESLWLFGNQSSWYRFLLRDGQPGWQYNTSNEWAMCPASAFEQPPLRSFVFSYEGYYVWTVTMSTSIIVLIPRFRHIHIHTSSYNKDALLNLKF